MAQPIMVEKPRQRGLEAAPPCTQRQEAEHKERLHADVQPRFLTYTAQELT